MNFFQRELRQVHMKRPHSKVTLKVSRHALLESVRKTSSLSIVIKLFLLENFLVLFWLYFAGYLFHEMHISVLFNKHVY